jgi:phospholipase C
VLCPTGNITFILLESEYLRVYTFAGAMPPPGGGSTMTNSDQPAGSAVGNITNIIVLMFENRSFDHLLGANRKADGVVDQNGNILPNLYNTKNPVVSPDSPADLKYYPTPIVPDIGHEHRHNRESRAFEGDKFNHEFSRGMLCELYGPGTTGVIGGIPQNAPVTDPPTNSGFLVAPGNDRGKKDIAGAMSYFEWGSMKVFHQLAEQFVICDQWHCDMPGHTAPNRAFMHCATTGDLGIDDLDYASLEHAPKQQGDYRVNRRTIYENIQEYEQTWTWKMYWQGSNCDTDWLNTTIFQQQYDPNQQLNYNVTQVPLHNFFRDLAGGTLPFYSFIMTFNDCGAETSMHPNSPVESGENLLAVIYNHLRASDYWNNTLLIVNFDESGGLYDHRSVPVTNPPDKNAPVSHWVWSDFGQIYSFDFSVLGPRIPVLLISPWLMKGGICSTPYQNTSILRFVQDLVAGGLDAMFLTERDLNARSIAGVFDYANCGLPEMRDDCPREMPLYVGTKETPVVTEEQILGNIGPTPEQLAATPAPHILGLTKQSLMGLPGHPDSGKPITRDFATVAELRAYAKERRDAALAELRKEQAAE